MAARDNYSRRRAADGTWEAYYIDSDDEFRVASAAGAVVYPHPVSLSPRQKLVPGRYVINMTVRATFHGRGNRTYQRTLNITRTVNNGMRTRMQGILEKAVDEWVDDQFSSGSPPDVDIVDYDVVEVDGDPNLLDMPLMGVNHNLLRYFRTAAVNTQGGAPALGEQRIEYARNMDIEHHVSGKECVADYLLYEAAKTDSRKGHWTRAFLREKLGVAPSTSKILAFAREEGDISVYAVDCMMKLIANVTAAKPRVWLIFMVKERHCLPITNDKWRAYITHQGGVPLEGVTFDRWSVGEAEYLEDPNPAAWLPFIQAPLPAMEEEGEEEEEAGGGGGMGDEDGDGEEAATATKPKRKKAVTVRVLAAEDLDMLAADVTAVTGRVIERISWRRGHIYAFVHPVNGGVVVAGRDFKVRKEICDGLAATYRVDDFAFVNQSWGAIAAAYLRTKHACLPSSAYGTEYLDILTRYPLGPYRACPSTDRVVKAGDTSIDIRRCYSHILRAMPVEWPVFGPLDYVQALPTGLASSDPAVLPAGEYYVARAIEMGGGSIWLSPGWYPSVVVQYALAKGYISRADVTYALKASMRLPANVFTDFADDVDATYPEYSKELLNCFVGCLGSQFKMETTSGTTTELETAVATLAAIQRRGNEGSMFMYNGVAILQEVTRHRKTQGHMPLYRAILGCSYVLLDEMTLAVCTPDTRILCFNTDSMKVRGPLKAEALKAKEDAAWGEYHLEDSVVLSGRPLEELPVREAYSLIREPVTSVHEGALGAGDWTARLKSGSGLIMGPPGCGKTYLLAALYDSVKDQEGVVVTAYTHAACQNLRDKGLPAVVFSSLVFNPRTRGMDPDKLSACTRLILDEYTMLPPSEMRVLLQARAAYGFEIWAAGDHRQCPAPVDNPVEYHTNPLFLEAVGNYVVRLKYKPGTGRYDESLHTAIRTFQTTGKLTAWVGAPPPPDVCYRNICLTNAKRRAINTAVRDHWLAHEAHGAVVDVGTPARPFVLAEGMPVMAYHGHLHEHDILKTQVWSVESIDGLASKVTLSMEGREEPVELDWRAFVEVFDYPFAVTAQKCQGLTLPEFVVHETSHPRMTFNTLYTAISRGVTIEKVHLAEPADPARIYMPQEMGRSLLLSGDALAPKLYPLVIFRVVAAPGASPYIGFATGDDEVGAAVAALRRRRPAGMPKPGPAAATSVLARVFVLNPGDAYAIVAEYAAAERAGLGGSVVYEAGRATAAAAVDDDGDGGGDGDGPAAAGGGGGAASRVRKRKFEPKECDKACCFTVRCRASTIPLEHQARKFMYKAGDAVSRDKALADAEAWATQMRATYY
jgi:hypothetical protein